MKMGGKKKGEMSFIRGINSEDDWKNLLNQQGGLTVVDVYNEWSGPCNAMSASLKKIKLEVGDDNLTYAMAKADSIPDLEVFREHCKPTWLFIASGETVAVMHGCNALLMRTMVEEQIEKEKNVLAGVQERTTISLRKAVPLKKFVSFELEEEERLKKEAEQTAKEARAAMYDGVVLVPEEDGVEEVVTNITEAGINCEVKLRLKFEDGDLDDAETAVDVMQEITDKYFLVILLRKDPDKLDEDGNLDDIIADIPDLVDTCFWPKDDILETVKQIVKEVKSQMIFTTSEQMEELQTELDQKSLLIKQEKRREDINNEEGGDREEEKEHDLWKIPTADETSEETTSNANVILHLVGREKNLTEFETKVLHRLIDPSKDEIVKYFP